MASQLLLPDPVGLPPTVMFHREHPSEPIVVLQVPVPGATDAETYMVRLDRAEHRTWLEGLKESRRLKDLLQMEQHILYEPGTGYSVGVPDLDRPGPFQESFNTARRQAARGVGVSRHFERRRQGQVPMSQFRMGMLGRRPQ